MRRQCLHPDPLLFLAHLQGLNLLRLGNLLLEPHLFELLQLGRFLRLALCFDFLLVELVLPRGLLLHGFLLSLGLLTLLFHLGLEGSVLFLGFGEGIGC